MKTIAGAALAAAMTCAWASGADAYSLDFTIMYNTPADGAALITIDDNTATQIAYITVFSSDQVFSNTGYYYEYFNFFGKASVTNLLTSTFIDPNGNYASENVSFDLDIVSGSGTATTDQGASAPYSLIGTKSSVNIFAEYDFLPPRFLGEIDASVSGTDDIAQNGGNTSVYFQSGDPILTALPVPTTWMLFASALTLFGGVGTAGRRIRSYAV